MRRTKKLGQLILSPRDLRKYDSIERNMLSFGFLLVVVAILGLAFVIEEYGYNIIVHDSNGNKTIERTKPEPPPGVTKKLF